MPSSQRLSRCCQRLLLQLLLSDTTLPCFPPTIFRDFQFFDFGAPFARAAETSLKVTRLLGADMNASTDGLRSGCMACMPCS